MSTCKITACALIDTWNERSVWGDLHEQGDCWVFDACVHPDSKHAAWSEGGVDPDHAHASTRALIYSGDVDAFERRGVIVLAKSSCRLNATAREYVR